MPRPWRWTGRRRSRKACPRLISCKISWGSDGEPRPKRRSARWWPASKHRYVDPNFIAVAAMVLGHRDLALQWLERGVDLHYSNAPLVTRFREFRPLRSDPRYQRLLHRMGLDTTPP